MPDDRDSVTAASSHSYKAFSPVLWIVLLVGVLMHVAGVLIFRIVSNPLPTRLDRGSFVQYVSSDSLTGDMEFEERAVLFDSAPLFLPTRWSAARGINFQGSGFVPPGFVRFEPEIDVIGDLNVGRFAGLENFEVAVPMDILSSRFLRFFQEFGAQPESSFSFKDSASFAQIEVISNWGLPSASTAESVPVEFETPVTVRPEAPAHFLVRLIGGGYSASAPLMEQSSGSEDFDRAAARWLQASTLIGGLSEGYYRIKIYSK